jgi:hypothetical protein
MPERNEGGGRAGMQDSLSMYMDFYGKPSWPEEFRWVFSSVATFISDELEEAKVTLENFLSREMLVEILAGSDDIMKGQDNVIALLQEKDRKILTAVAAKFLRQAFGNEDPNATPEVRRSMAAIIFELILNQCKSRDEATTYLRQLNGLNQKLLTEAVEPFVDKLRKSLMELKVKYEVEVVKHQRLMQAETDGYHEVVRVKEGEVNFSDRSLKEEREKISLLERLLRNLEGLASNLQTPHVLVFDASAS